MTMDAAARAELDALRLRAYGPAPDIAADPVALARLADLEDLALPAIPADAEPARPADAEPAREPEVGSAAAAASRVRIDAAPEDARVVGIVPPAERHRRRGWHTALVAAVAVAGLILGATAASRTLEAPASDTAAGRPAGGIPAGVREAAAFVGHPQSDVLIEVRIDGSFGDYVDITASDVPLFPVENPMTWVEPLGDYYGWRVWIGGARGAGGDENCLLLDGEGTMRADCVPTDLKAQGALLVSVPYDGVAADERPPEMSPGQSLGFWWGPDGIVTILLGPTDADPAGATTLLNTGRPEAQGPRGTTVLPVLIDADTGDFVDLSAIADAPEVPASGEMTWAQPLGRHFGWDLWIGSAPSRRGDQFCILLTDDSLTRSRCASGEWDAEGDLVVSLPYALIHEADRPPEMIDGQSIAFAWDRGGTVTVQVTPIAPG
jgi:hypothetical protein